MISCIPLVCVWCLNKQSCVCASSEAVGWSPSSGHNTYVGEWKEDDDVVNNKLEHRWWMRAKAGVAFVKGKCIPKEEGVRFCRRCGLAPESFTHNMWECENLPLKEVQHIIPKVLNWESHIIMGWMFDTRRNRMQRLVLDGYIHGRVKELEEIWSRPLTFLSPG